MPLKDEPNPNPQPTRVPKGGSTFRIRGVPLGWDKNQLQAHLEFHEPASRPVIKSLANEIDGQFRTATVNFESPPTVEKTSKPWYISLPESENDGAISNLPLRLDGDFLGITTLFAPPVEDHEVDIVAVSGLGGHAYGSFKDKNGNYMWLQDSLPFDLTNDDSHRPIARVMIYGHKSTVNKSNSVQDIDDLATALHSSLLALSQNSRAKPIILMGHSLGGLIIKKALITLSKSRSQEDQKLLRAIYGIVFFGVPHGGMDIASLIPMAGDGPNRPLLESISAPSPVLDRLQTEFHPALGEQGDAEVICFYETEESPTAQQGQDGKWRMSGPLAVLVTQSSAVHCRSWENDSIHICPIARSHSEIVKFGPVDSYYGGVRDRLHGLAQRAVKIQRRI
ncbi:hypothetical protein TARUN_7122 [Trichoderma arundinaceum]|uniref:DUF676 domain-containing protein n=1 Tax=Trichoderma arundinaceum TaxID=490622 RepID=A0A395NGI8_TRIAR|nr:hypothetical protein TARUN_7122 [Trichoderma arundinaceum]